MQNLNDLLRIRKQIISLATSLVLKETAETGQDYSEILPKAIEEACERLGIKHKEFIRMFI